MKKMFLLFTLIIFTYSCEKEDFKDGSGHSSDLNDEITVVKGRLYFPTQEDFTREYDNIKEKTDKEIYNKVSKFYSEDFLSLRPIVTTENEQEVYEKLLIRKEKFIDYKIKSASISRGSNTNSFKISDEDFLDHIDDLEDIIGDEAFASFLNSNGEIQIGTKIYKYTDLGLFISSDYEKLITYLDIKNISKNLLVQTDENSGNNFLSSTSHGLNQIENNLDYYRVQYIKEDHIDDGEGGGGGGGSGGSSGATTYEAYIANLQPCSPTSGFFGSLFGTNKVCIDRFESRQRVKTKAFNYDYLIAYHIGVKVKHQDKTWYGIWKRQDTDNMAMIVENATFKYDFTNIVGSALANLNQKQVFISPNQISPASHKGYYEVNVDNGWNNFTTVNFDYTPYYPYPFPIFHDDLVIETWGNNSIVEAAVNAGNDLLTKQKLNQYAWNFLYDKSKDYLKSTATGSYELPNNITVLSKHTVGEVWVHKSLKRFGTNCSRIQKTFDWGIGISITLNANNGFQLKKANIGPYQPQTPEGYGVKIYGLAKRNGKWHGSLLVF
jgi:hypothetical protein